jgi:hypothetical protein
MQTRKYQVLDGTPVTNVAGARAVLTVGDAEVHHTAAGFVIAVGEVAPVTVSAAEFERLIVEGQLHGLPAARTDDDTSAHDAD